MQPLVVMTPNAAFPDEVPVFRAPLKLSWGALFGGIFVTLGVWLLLTVLGLAVGLSSIDPESPRTLRSAGMGAGIWTAIVPLVALFFGGLVAARCAGIVDRVTGSLHGAVLWGVTTIASVVLMGMIVAGLASAAVGLGSRVAGAAGDVLGAGAQAGPGVGRVLGVDADDLLGPVNQQLRAEGKPTVTAQQLTAAMRDVAASALREGRLDRDLLTSRIAEHTRLSEGDARQIADRIEARFEERKAAMSGTGQAVQTEALEAAQDTGKAMWWAFLGMVLGLGSAVLGATLGVSRKQRLAATERVPLSTTREVLP